MADHDSNVVSILPVFEVELDLNKADGPLQKVEIDANSNVHLRCLIKGDIHEIPDLSWLYAGTPLLTTDHIVVETDHAKLFTTLKLVKARPGIYECGAQSKSDGKLHRKKLKLIHKSVSQNHPLFGETTCDKQHTDYCQHGGICLYNPGTEIYSCRCLDGFSGTRCEYKDQGVHDLVIIDPGATNNAVALTTGIFGFLFISLILAFFIYVKKRDQIKFFYNRKRNKATKNGFTAPMNGLIDDTITIDTSHTIERTVWKPSLSLDERIKFIKALLPARCPHCKRTLGINGKLDALSTHIAAASRNSTPPMLSYPCLDIISSIENHNTGRSVSESCYFIDEVPVNGKGNQLSPSNQFKGPGLSNKKLGALKDHISVNYKSDIPRLVVSTLVSPVNETNMLKQNNDGIDHFQLQDNNHNIPKLLKSKNEHQVTNAMNEMANNVESEALLH